MFNTHNITELDVSNKNEDFEDLDFYAVSGSKELNISENNIHSVNINVDGGEVKIENSTTDDLNIDMAMGESKYQGQVLKNADIECSMGEVDLELSGRKEDFNYTIECSAGEVEITNDMTIRFKMPILPSVKSSSVRVVVGIFSLFIPPPKRAFEASLAFSASSSP